VNDILLSAPSIIIGLLHLLLIGADLAGSPLSPVRSRRRDLPSRGGAHHRGHSLLVPNPLREAPPRSACLVRLVISESPTALRDPASSPACCCDRPRRRWTSPLRFPRSSINSSASTLPTMARLQSTSNTSCKPLRLLEAACPWSGP